MAGTGVARSSQGPAGDRIDGRLSQRESGNHVWDQCVRRQDYVMGALPRSRRRPAAVGQDLSHPGAGGAGRPGRADAALPDGSRLHVVIPVSTHPTGRSSRGRRTEEAESASDAKRYEGAHPSLIVCPIGAVVTALLEPVRDVEDSRWTRSRDARRRPHQIDRLRRTLQAWYVPSSSEN